MNVTPADGQQQKHKMFPKSLYPVSNHQYVPTFNETHTARWVPHIPWITDTWWNRCTSEGRLCPQVSYVLTRSPRQYTIDEEKHEVKRQALTMIIQSVLTRMLTHTYSYVSLIWWHIFQAITRSQQSQSSGLLQYDLVFKCGFFVSKQPRLYSFYDTTSTFFKREIWHQTLRHTGQSCLYIYLQVLATYTCRIQQALTFKQHQSQCFSFKPQPICCGNSEEDHRVTLLKPQACLWCLFCDARWKKNEWMLHDRTQKTMSCSYVWWFSTI